MEPDACINGMFAKYTSIDTYPTSIVFLTYFYHLDKKLRMNNNLPMAYFFLFKHQIWFCVKDQRKDFG